MAQGRADDKTSGVGESAASRGLLMAPAVATAAEPARISLDLTKFSIPPRAQLELAVVPNSPGEAPYIVVVSVNGIAKPIGSFSFFRPPRPGEVQKFIVNALPLLDLVKASAPRQIDLSVQLVPVERGDNLSNAALRIVGARFVPG